jgi:hypothetical protein
MSCDALPWLRDIWQQFGQENQQLNKLGFLFSNCMFYQMKQLLQAESMLIMQMQ